MIQVFLLTGFLGAGKTTLLQSLLQSYRENKVGVIVNEFGEVNVDARLVERDGIEMAELSNGSIFCACIKDKFVEGLIAMSAMDLEYLFIEASGLADPANMGQILDGIRPRTVNALRLAGSVCVVDGESFLELSDVLPALQNQVAYANAVILNKADLMDESMVEKTVNAIRACNTGAEIYITSYCKADLQALAENMHENHKESEQTTNTYESRPSCFVLKAEAPLTQEGLCAFLAEIAPSAYRIKGFAQTDHGCKEVSCVLKNVAVTDWKAPISGSEIVVISAVGVKIIGRIMKASQTHLAGKLKL